VSATASAAPPIQVSGLSKTYRLGFWMNKRVRALEGLDLTVEPGQVYGLLGPNGAGKSTTIKILMNLVRPSSGRAELFGHDPASAEARRNVGFLPENPSPYEYLTGREFLRLSGALGGLSGHELDQRTREVLGLVGMERAADLQIRRYSKGMTQRIALAQALVNRPKLLILDEPTSGMDPVGRRQIRDLIFQERARGTTVLFCTHIISDAEVLCDRLLVLVGGRRVKEGAVRDLLSSEVPLVEMMIEGLSLEAARALGPELNHAQPVGDRLLVRVADKDSQPFLRRVLEANGRVTQVQPARFSLEDLFLEALQKNTGGTVGSEVS
jgi:ABC-2 type transport system ATP-binding protein